MPFASNKQRKFMYAVHPDIAKRWSKEEKGKETMKKGVKYRKQDVDEAVRRMKHG